MNLAVFRDLHLHHTRVDWDDPTLTPATLTNKFIGKTPYWKLPENVGKKWNEIEREILKEARFQNWGGVSKYGKPYYQHFLTLMKLMFPETDITDTVADAVMFFCLAISNDFKLLNLIGGQNMAKSASSARIAYVTMYIDPEYTVWTVANPFDNISESTIWGEIEILWEQLCKHYPHLSGDENKTALFPRGRKFADKKIEFIEGQAKAGLMKVMNVKHTARGKGMKSKKGPDGHALGVTGEILDEVNEIDNPAYLQIILNRASQDGYIGISSQNFKDIEDMGGRLTEPVPRDIPRLDGITSFEKLDINGDLWWFSRYQSITLRFDGHRSANIMAGRTIYPYLFKEADRVRLRESCGGEQAPGYMSQARSFPVNNGVSNSVLSREKLDSSRHTDEYFVIDPSTLKKVAFCDPSFGGGDLCTYGYASFGNGYIVDGAGDRVPHGLFVISEPFKNLKLVRNAVFNDFWRERMLALNLTVADMREGALITYEDQIALQCLEFNHLFSVPANHFGFDFSMRADIVSSMNKFMGFAIHAFNYNMGPEGHNLTGLNKESIECCKDRCTELAFLAADLFHSKQLRGGQFIPTAIVQLQRTHSNQVKNGKFQVEDKKTYKERWSGVSPDHRDVLMGLSGMAAKLGFFSSPLRTATEESGDKSSIFRALRKGNANWRTTVTPHEAKRLLREKANKVPFYER